ncbi:MAG: tRNA epoxyqueuosine(34) reductase QueG [Hyphomicrobiales bacterium]
MSASLKADVVARARNEGFDAVGFASAEGSARAANGLCEFLEKNHHGTMGWLSDTVERRISPRAMWPGAKSAIMLGVNYGPDLDPLARLMARETGVISVYALGHDYHDIIKKRLKRVARWLAEANGCEVKVFVDTAPLMEKPLAESAGIGWQGKHTNLVSREFGSWLFLGAILTGLEIEPDSPEEDHCGNCRACLDICPTDAFPAPYKLDARRCISYLTIEHQGHIDRELRPGMGNRIFGCDDCLAVCPWNKFAREGHEAKLKARENLCAPKLAELSTLGKDAFRAHFPASPVKRAGRNRFIRNVLVAIGNSSDSALAENAIALLKDESELVRAMAVWACGQLLQPEEFSRLRAHHEPNEEDEYVLSEWRFEV